MGTFYVNYVIKNADQKAVARTLAGRRAFVSPPHNGAVVVFDQESDKQDEKSIARLASQLATQLRCTVFAALVHDSDIFWYQLYTAGNWYQLHRAAKLTDEYNSTPNYWSQRPELLGPKGGDAMRLCAAFSCTEVDRVESILRASNSAYPDEMARHADLVDVLNLPPFCVGYDFETIVHGNLPDAMSSQNIIAIN